MEILSRTNSIAMRVVVLATVLQIFFSPFVPQAHSLPPSSLSLAWTGVGTSFFVTDQVVTPIPVAVSHEGDWIVPDVHQHHFFQGAEEATFLSQRPSAGTRLAGLGERVVRVQLRLSSGQIRWVPWSILLIDRTVPEGEIVLDATQTASLTSDGISLFTAPVMVSAQVTASDNIAVVQEDPALTSSTDDMPQATRLSEFVESRVGRHHLSVTIRDTSGNTRTLLKTFEIRNNERRPFNASVLEFACNQSGAGAFSLSTTLRLARTDPEFSGSIRKDSLKLFLLSADGSMIGEQPLSIRSEASQGWTTTASIFNRIDAFDLSLAVEGGNGTLAVCPSKIMIAGVGLTSSGTPFEIDERVDAAPTQAASNDGGIDLGECQSGEGVPIDGVPVCDLPVLSDPPNSPAECSWIARWIEKPFQNLKDDEEFPSPDAPPYYPGHASDWIKWLVEAKGKGEANHVVMGGQLSASAKSPLSIEAMMTAFLSTLQAILGQASGAGTVTPPWQLIGDIINALSQKHLSRLEISMIPTEVIDQATGQSSLVELAARGTFRVFLVPDNCPCSCDIDITGQRVQFLATASHSPSVDQLPIGASLPVSSATAAGGMKINSDCGAAVTEAGVQVGNLPSGSPNQWISVPLTNVSDPEYLVLGDSEPLSTKKVVSTALPSLVKAGIAAVPDCTVSSCSTDIKTAHAVTVETYVRNSYSTTVTINTHLQLAIQAALKPLGVGGSGSAQIQAQLMNLLAPFFTDSAAFAKVNNGQTRFQVTPEATCNGQEPSGNGIQVMAASNTFGG